MALTATESTSLPALLSSTSEARTEYLGVAGGFATAVAVAWPAWRAFVRIQRRCSGILSATQKVPDVADVEPGLSAGEAGEDQDKNSSSMAEPVDLEAKDMEVVEMEMCGKGLPHLKISESAASQLRHAKRQELLACEESCEGRGNTNHDDFGPEAGRGVLLPQRQDDPTDCHTQSHLTQRELLDRPALKLRNFRSLDGKAFDHGESEALAAFGDTVSHHANRGEPQEVSDQHVANAVSDFQPVQAGIEVVTQDRPDIPNAPHQNAGFDQPQLATRPALQLRNFRSLDGKAFDHGESEALAAFGDTVSHHANRGEPQEVSDQHVANAVSDFQPVQAGIEVATQDRADIPNAPHQNAGFDHPQLATRPALQLRNFRSLDGKAERGQEGNAEREVRGDQSNGSLPGSVPAKPLVDEFHLAADGGETHQREEKEVSDQHVAKAVSDFQPVQAGIEVATQDRADIPNAPHQNAGFDHPQLATRPALQLRNFRSLDGKAERGQEGNAEREVRGDQSNGSLPGSVPAKPLVDEFHLAADGGETHQREEKEVSDQHVAKAVSDFQPVQAGIEVATQDRPDIPNAVQAGIEVATQDRPDIPNARNQNAGFDHPQLATRPALQLRKFRSLPRSLSPKFWKGSQDDRGSDSPPSLSADPTRRLSPPLGPSLSDGSEGELKEQQEEHGTEGAHGTSAETADESGNGLPLSPALNLRDLRSCLALHQQRKEELEKCVASFAQSDEFHERIMQTEEAHALLQSLLPRSSDSPSPTRKPKAPYLLSVALKRAEEPAEKDSHRALDL
eukprot:Skav212459  [mRNA]  locus=scaffold385:209729:213478:- [translate_table: standard]